MRHFTKRMLVWLAVILSLTFVSSMALADGGGEETAPGAGGLPIQKDAPGKKLKGVMYGEINNYDPSNGDYGLDFPSADFLTVMLRLERKGLTGLFYTVLDCSDEILMLTCVNYRFHVNNLNMMNALLNRWKKDGEIFAFFGFKPDSTIPLRDFTEVGPLVLYDPTAYVYSKFSLSNIELAVKQKGDKTPDD